MYYAILPAPSLLNMYTWYIESSRAANAQCRGLGPTRQGYLNWTHRVSQLLPSQGIQSRGGREINDINLRAQSLSNSKKCSQASPCPPFRNGGMRRVRRGGTILQRPRNLYHLHVRHVLPSRSQRRGLQRPRRVCSRCLRLQVTCPALFKLTGDLRAWTNIRVVRHLCDIPTRRDCSFYSTEAPEYARTLDPTSTLLTTQAVRSM